jgi:uracil phosphoribosyltransferase
MEDPHRTQNRVNGSRGAQFLLTGAEIETPLAPSQARSIAGKKLVIAPVLRAGVDLVRARAWPTPVFTRAGDVPGSGVSFFKAPADLHARLLFVVSP